MKRRLFQSLVTIGFLLAIGGCSTTFVPEAPGAGPRVVLKNPLSEGEGRLQQPDVKAPDYLALARDLVAQRDPQYYDTAFVFLDKADAGQPDNPEVDYLKGVVLREKGDNEGARTHFASALAKSPDHADAYHALARLSAFAGETDEALMYYGKALAIEPDRAEFNNDMGFALLASGDWHRAEPYLRKSAAAARASHTAVNNLALCLGMNGSQEEALELLMQHYPPAPAHNNMGVIYRIKGDRRNALAMFREALRLDPELEIAAANLEAALGIENRN